MQKKVTLQHIATEAGVSKATVSMILNRRGINNFNQDTVALVYKLAAEMNYVSVRGKRYDNESVEAKTIKIIVPSFFNPIYSNMVKGIEDAAMEAGYQTIIRTTYWDAEREKSFLEKAQTKHVDGVIFCMVPQNIEYVCDASRRLPIVVVGDKRAELQMSTIDINNFSSGRRLAHYLHSLGHKEIAMVAGGFHKHNKTMANRCLGMRSYCEENDLSFYIYAANNGLVDAHEEGNADFLAGYELTEKSLLEYPEITALVASNDLLAMGVYKALEDMGLSVPEDISVCCFDNMMPNAFKGNQLTCIDHSLDECGRSAFELLISQMAKIENQGYAAGYTHIEFPCSLLEGSSTAAPRTEPLPDLLLSDSPDVLVDGGLQFDQSVLPKQQQKEA